MSKKINVFKNYADNIFLSLEVCFCFASLIFLSFKLNYLSSLFFDIIFVFLLIWFLFRFVFYLIDNKGQIFKNRKLVTSFFLLIAVGLFGLVSVVVSYCSPHSTGFTQVNYYIIFMSGCLSIHLITFGKFNKYIFIIPLILAIIFSSLLIFQYLIGYARNFEGLKSEKGLKFNFSNSNLSGIIVFSLIMFLIYGAFYFRKVYIKILLLPIVIELVYLYVLTSGRAPILALVAAVAIVLLIMLDRKKRFTISLAFFVSVVPIIFIFVYLLYFKIAFPDGNVIGSYTAEFGEGLSSRYYIFNSVLSSSIGDLKTFLFGNFFNAGTNSHNSFCSILVSYGFLTVVPYYLFLIFSVYCILKQTTILKFSQLFGLVFFFYYIYLGLVEACPILTSNGMFAIFSLSILMCKIPIGKSFVSERNKILHEDANRVLIISNVFNVGSIGKIVKNCNDYNNSHGWDSFVIYGRGLDSFESNSACVESLMDLYFTKLIRKITKSQSAGALLMTNEIIKCIKDYKPDIVHIAAVNDNYLNFRILFKYLAKKNIKTVYTHHSEYMYLGLCGGHAYECSGFKTGCLDCKKFKTKLSKKCLSQKQKLISNFNDKTFVTTSVSPWLHKRVLDSLVFNNITDYVVFNGSDISKYYASPLVLNNDKYILYVTASLSNKSKKNNDILEIAKLMSNYKFLIVTLVNNPKIKLPDNVEVKTNVTDSGELASIYRNALVTVTTGTRETFSMPIMESILCGIPVAGYECGGPESVFKFEYTKFSKNGDINLLIKNIYNIINQNFDSDKIHKEATIFFDSFVMASNYINVYNKLIEKKISIINL